MRKIFSLFVALTAVMSLSAKTVYLEVNDDWKSFEAVFFVHSWGAEENDVKLTPVDGEEYLFSANIPDGNNNLVFVRAKGGSESIPWETEDLWNKTSDLEIPDGKDCFWLIGWTSGTWLVKGERPEVAIVGDFAGNDDWWAPVAENTMVPAGDKKTATVTLHLNAATYLMKVWVAGSYLSLNGEGDSKFRIHREWNHAENVNLDGDGRNFELEADEDGDYVFTWNYEKRNLEVAFPATTPTGTINANTNANVVKCMVNGQLIIIRDGKTFNATGAEVR